MIRPGFIPIVARELSILSRRRATYLARVFIVVGAILVLIGASVDGVTQVQGRRLFTILSWIALAYSLIGGIIATSDSLSAEKREGTLGLLFLTHLKGRDVVLGKIAASSTSLLYGVFALAPVLAIGFLFGGVSWDEMFRLVIALISSALFALAVGTLISSLSRDERTAMFMSIFLVGVWTLGPHYVRYVRSIGVVPGARPFPTEWLAASPLRAFELAFVGPLAVMPPMTSFLKTIGVLWSIGVGSLAIASFVLPRTLQERVRTRKWRENFAKTRSERQRPWRERLLDRSPFAWLAGRDRTRPFAVWFFVLSMFVLFVWLFRKGAVLNTPDLMAFLAFIIQLVLKIWVLSETCTRCVEDRRSGAYELLLCSPLSLREMARGQAMALRTQFLPPVALLLAGEFFLARYFSQPSAKWHFGIPAAVFVFDLWALYQVARWQALFTNSSTRAWFQTALRILILPWLVYFCYHAAMTIAMVTAAGFGTISPTLPETNFLAWLCISVAVDLIFGLSARWSFFKKFREIAAARFTAKPGALLAAVEADSAEAAAARAKRRIRRKRIRRGVLAGAGLILLLVLGRHGYAHYRISRSIAAARKAGEPTTFEELSKWGPKVPPERDGVLLLSAAVGNNFAAGGVVLSKPNHSRVNLSVEEAFFRSNLKIVADIHAALQQTRTSVSVREPASQTAFQTVSAVIRLLEAQSKEPEQAWVAAVDLFRLNRLLGQIPNWGNSEWRLRILHHATIAVETAIRGENSIETIRQMRREIEATRDPGVWRRELAALRCLVCEMAKQPIRFSGWGAPAQPRWQTAVLLARVQWQRLTGSFQLGCAEFITAIDRIIRTTEMPLSEGMLNESEVLPRQGQTAFLQFNGIWQLLANVNVNRAREEAFYRVADAAMALAECRISHRGAWPERLQDLVPAFLKSVPIDPLDGQPLRYRPASFQGMLLYSVGGNRSDDGGNDTLARPKLSGIWTYDPLDICVHLGE